MSGTVLDRTDGARNEATRRPGMRLAPSFPTLPTSVSTNSESPPCRDTNMLRGGPGREAGPAFFRPASMPRMMLPCFRSNSMKRGKQARRLICSASPA